MKKQLTVFIDLDLIQRLRSNKLLTGVTQSYQVSIALNRLFDNSAKKARKTPFKKNGDLNGRERRL